MAQQLIVEGKDAVFLAHLMMKRKVSPPKGYENPKKFKEEFVKSAGGISKMARAIKEALDYPDITNLGIIVDANEVGPRKRFEHLLELMGKDLNIDREFLLKKEGFIHEFGEGLKIGIWVMPDNINKGYLEHFASALIDQDNEIYAFAVDTVENFTQKAYSSLSEAKVQKAKVHTYLALQNNPGQPLGIAVKMNYFKAESEHANLFVNWFKNTFDFSA